MPFSKTEKRLYAVLIVLAVLGVTASALDLLGVFPGLGGQSAPLLVGLLALALLGHYRELTRVRLITRQVQRSLERASSPPEKQADRKRDGKRKKKNQRQPPERPAYREIPWHGFILRSHSEMKIARELDRTGALFLADTKIRLKTESSRQTREVDFLVNYQGKWGILEVDGPHHHAGADEWRDARFREHGMFVRRFPADQCFREPRLVVKQFLEELTMQVIEASPPPPFVALPPLIPMLPQAEAGTPEIRPEIRVVKVDEETPSDAPPTSPTPA